MSIEYKINEPITTEQYIELLKSTTLGERRPIDDLECMEGMISNSNLMVSAWDKGQLVGIARSLTDFHYSCYLSDLAVSDKYQKTGKGFFIKGIVSKAGYRRSPLFGGGLLLRCRAAKSPQNRGVCPTP